MSLPFSERARLAMAYAIKSPASIAGTAPLAKNEEVTSFTVTLADPQTPVEVRVTRSADSAEIVFAAGNTVIDRGRIHRSHLGWEAVERVRALAHKALASAPDGGLGAKLDQILLS